MPTCQVCRQENPAGARFCNDCGARLGASTIAPEPRAYTPQHLVDKILASQSALRGERKLVTVLFADVVRSMELAERVDPEEWHRLLDRLFRILSGGIHRYEGTINQYTGDGIMALFAPLPAFLNQVRPSQTEGDHILLGGILRSMPSGRRDLPADEAKMGRAQ